MCEAVSLPVTVKHRIGVDELDRYEDMANFVRVVSEAGADRFTRPRAQGLVAGLEPQGRTAPCRPLRYEEVGRLKREFPHLTIEINGGFIDLDAVRAQLSWVDGVMLGRAAYENPFLFATVDRDFYGDAAPPPTRREVVEGLLPYLEQQLSQGTHLNRITRHVLGLFAHQPGAKGLEAAPERERAPSGGGG